MDVFEGLDPEQAQAVSRLEGGLLLMAPVGTGKTTVIARRAAHAVNSGVDPDRILCLTFTNRAAREMRDRIRSYCGVEGAGIWVGTFHAFCAMVLRREADRLGLFADFCVYDEEDSHGILREVWQELGVKANPNDYGRLEQLLYRCAETAKLGPHLGRAVDLRKMFWSELSRVPLRGTVISAAFDPARVLERYNERLIDNHALNFADLVARVAGLFSEDPEALARWRERFCWIQVDEMQDTNLAEYAVISALAREHKNLALFGDLDQTVYEWRDSVPQEIVRRFRREFAPVRRGEPAAQLPFHGPHPQGLRGGDRPLPERGHPGPALPVRRGRAENRGAGRANPGGRSAPDRRPDTPAGRGRAFLREHGRPLPDQPLLRAGFRRP